MGLVNGLRTLRALAAGTLTGAQLQAQLAHGTERASWQELLTSRSAVRFLQDSPTALAAVGASPLAVADIVRSAVASPQVCSDRFALNVLQAAPAGGRILDGERDTGLALESMLRYATLGQATPHSAALVSLPTLAAVRSNAVVLSAILQNAKACNLLASSETYRTSLLGARSQSAASEFQRFMGMGSGSGVAKMVAASVGIAPAEVSGAAALLSNAAIKAAWMGNKDLYLAVTDTPVAVSVLGNTTAIGEVLNAGRMLDGFGSDAALAAATSWAEVMGSLPLLNALSVSSCALAFVGNSTAALAAALASANARSVLFPIQEFWTAALRTGTGRVAIGTNATAMGQLTAGVANAALTAASGMNCSFSWVVGGVYGTASNVPSGGGIVRKYTMPTAPRDQYSPVMVASSTLGGEAALAQSVGWTANIFGSSLSAARTQNNYAASMASTLTLDVLPYVIP